MSRHLLVIGNSKYNNEVDFDEIVHTKDDAEKVFDLLTDENKGSFNRETSIIDLNIGVDWIKPNLIKFFQKIKATDLVLFYFAGHARKIGNKRLILILQDTEKNTLAGSGFNLDDFIVYLEERKVNRYIIVLDCCYSGVALESPTIKHRGDADELQKIDLNDIEDKTGRGKIIVASSSKGQLSHEDSKLKHGIFSYYFIKGIKEGCEISDSKEYISISDLVSFIQKKVKENHLDIFQEPLMSGTHMSGDLIICKNPKFKSEKANVSEMIEYQKKSLDLDSLADKDAIEQARITKFRQFLDALAKTSRKLKTYKEAIYLHGKALLIKEQIINEEYDNYIAYLNFGDYTFHKDIFENINGKGRAMVFSAAFGYNAIESPSLQSGLFSYYFRQALEGRGANKNGYVTLASAYQYLNTQVHSFEQASHQKPIFVAKLSSEPILTSESIEWHNKKNKRVAILIGVDIYTDKKISSLNFAVSDAISLSNVLKKSGGFDECITLTNEEATHYKVTTTIYETLSSLGKEDLFFFYFSGHGFSLPEEGNAVLYDSKVEDRKSLSLLRITELSRMANTSKVGTSIFVVDACMSPANNVAYELLG